MVHRKSFKDLLVTSRNHVHNMESEIPQVNSLFIQFLKPIARGVGAALLCQFLQEVKGLLEHLQQEIFKLLRNTIFAQKFIDTVH